MGYAPVLCAAQDEATDRWAVELIDALVEHANRPRCSGVTTALTSAALTRCLNLPCLAHVVHSAERVAAGNGDRIGATLLTQGWAPDHVFWRRLAHPHDERRLTWTLYDDGAPDRHAAGWICEPDRSPYPWNLCELQTGPTCTDLRRP